jgi:hypothetical protein
MGFTTDVGIYVGLLAIALGKSSEDPILNEFLAYQLRGSHEDPILEEFLADQLRGSHEGPHAYEEKMVARGSIWWNIAGLFGLFIVYFRGWCCFMGTNLLDFYHGYGNKFFVVLVWLLLLPSPKSSRESP